MTVSTTDVARTYPADSVTTDFSYPIPFIGSADLHVTLLDHATGVPVSPAPVLNGGAPHDYILLASEPPPNLTHPTGATVRFNAAPATGLDITLTRATPQLQPITLVDDAKFPAGTVNLEFDRLTMIDQEQQKGLDFIFGILPLLDTGNPLLGLIMKWRGNWQTNTGYGLGDTVIGPGQGLYVCMVIHTSGAVFTGAEWAIAVDMTSLNAAVAAAQAAAIAAQAAAAIIPAPGGAGNAGFVPAVNAAGNAYALRSALLALIADPNNKWDAQNKLLTNVRAAVSGTDAVNLTQMNAAIVASGAVPVPGAPDIDKALIATGAGAFSWQPVTLARISDMSAYMRGLNAAASAAAALASLGGVPTSRQIIAGTGLTGGGDLSADRTLTHANSAVTPGSYTNANITVDARGHITLAANGSVSQAIYVTTAINLGLDASYRGGVVDCTAAVTITLPALVAGDKGYTVLIANISATITDLTTIVGPAGELIDGVSSRVIWPGTKLNLLWTGTAWKSINEGWIPASRSYATLGTELEIHQSLMMVPTLARELLVNIDGYQPVGGTTDWGMRFSFDGNVTYDATAAGYQFEGAIYNYGGGSSAFISAGNPDLRLTFNVASNAALTEASKGSVRMTIGSPRAGGRAVYKYDFLYPTSATVNEGGFALGNHITAHSIDGLQLINVVAARTMAVGTFMEAYWR